ncbi:MAG TPA: PqqD family protein [Gemmatimonadales bacterium]|nr:PqqD family protein [Gemmatimonadales bacterium]
MTDVSWSPQAIVVVSNDQVSCQLGDDAAILHVGSGQYYTLNRVGARVWALLQEPIPIQRLRDTLFAEFDVPRDRLDRELLDLLRRLSSEKLIDVRDGPAA